MFLKRLYSKPGGLFKEVEFKDGINFIFGKKSANPKESLNGIGKSLLLDLIDFCLGASFNQNHSPRLFKALTRVPACRIVLEFEMEGKEYLISRSSEDANENVEFGEKDDTRFYKLAALKPVLCDLIFRNPDYSGVYSNKWLRKLIPFFIKIERVKKQPYIDPIRYINELTPLELNLYHLFFMGINNHLAYENYKARTDLKAKVPTINEIGNIIKETYGFRDLSEATSTS